MLLLSKLTIDLRPLLVFLIVLAIVVALRATYWRFKERKSKQLMKGLSEEKYDAVIKDGEKLLAFYMRGNAQLPKKEFLAQTNSVQRSQKAFLGRVEYLHCMLAIAFFSKADFENFLKHINELSQNADFKEFWLALYELEQNHDIAAATNHYENISRCENTKKVLLLLEGLLLEKQGDREAAKEKIKEITEPLQYPILRKLADRILL